ncbi:hypothetical protein HWV07_07045 [Natronomonas salina]|uniref:hypothetical protein n=1 Tax=Natronomonas salina TaxID=1710540 RepID=UPI0015B6C96E|nr:hypothetical protein [Natronomonas salina]QLD88802.1 hypothetical protein HWV07_07045 [Natronomonas salina]
MNRRTVLKNGAIAIGGVTAASGTVSAGKKKNNSAQAGWALASGTHCKNCKKYTKFEVNKQTGYAGFPAGCSPNSQEKTYVCYQVTFKGKSGSTYNTRLYRRKNMKQFETGAYYTVKHVKSCGDNCRVHFQRR